MWMNSGREAMNAANAAPLNAPPLSVTILIRFGRPVPGSIGSWSSSGTPPAMVSASTMASLTAAMASAPGAARGQVPAVLVLGVVVAAAGQPPDPAGGGLILGEIQLPHLVRARGRLGEGRRAGLGELAPLALVVDRLQQPPAAHRPFHTGLWQALPGGAPPGEDLAVPPGRPIRRVLGHQRLSRVDHGCRPRPLRGHADAGLGQPAVVRAPWDAGQLAEPRDRHPRLLADHLEVLKGASRPSADFFHTRSSTCASPSAVVSSATSAASASSREDGRDAPPAARPSLPASRNCCFHLPIDVSDTLLRRAASAIVVSPASTDNTIRILSSAEKTGGRLIRSTPWIRAN